MAAEYSANAVQLVLPNQPVIFTESPVPCNRGFIFHRDESGTFRLASLARRLFASSCCCRRLLETQYRVEFHANIAVPTDGTVEPINLAIAIDGQVDPSSIMEFTPAAVDQYGNVSAGIIVSVPSVCGCETISVVNTGTTVTGINVRNANILIDVLGVRAAAA